MIEWAWLVMMGEMLGEIEPKYETSPVPSFERRKSKTKVLPEGITHKESHQAQTIARGSRKDVSGNKTQRPAWAR